MRKHEILSRLKYLRKLIFGKSPSEIIDSKEKLEIYRLIQIVENQDARRIDIESILNRANKLYKQCVKNTEITYGMNDYLRESLMDEFN